MTIEQADTICGLLAELVGKLDELLNRRLASDKVLERLLRDIKEGGKN